MKNIDAKKSIILLLGLWVLLGCGVESIYNPVDDVVLNENRFLEVNTDLYSAEVSWAFDVSDVDVLIDDADVVVKVQVLSTGQNATFDQSGMPKTAVSVKVIDEIKGDGSIIDAFYYPGGVYSLEQYYKANPQSAEKAGISDMTQAERESTFVTFYHDGYIALVEDATYIMVLNHNGDGTYTLGSLGYGLFRLDTDGVSYLNDITRTVYTESDFR